MYSATLIMPQLLHQRVIRAGEMFVVKGLNDRVGNDDRAGNDGVGRRCAAFDQNFVGDCEVVFNESLALV